MLARMLCLSAMLITVSTFELPRVDPNRPARVRSAAPFLRSSADFAKPARPLWPGAGFTEEDRARAIYRGLEYIYRTARSPRNFARHGYDFLWCFDTTAKAVKDATARGMALRMGAELAHRWRRGHRALPRNADAYTVYVFASADEAADGLGVPDDTIKEKIKVAAARFTARDFLDFDPATVVKPGVYLALCASDLPASPYLTPVMCFHQRL